MAFKLKNFIITTLLCATIFSFHDKLSIAAEDNSFKEKLNHIFDSNELYNPAFHGKKHSIELAFAGGVSNRYNHHQFDNGYYNLSARYAIPTHLFIHGKTSIEVGGILGTVTDVQNGNIHQIYGGFMHEFLFDWKYFYSTLGLGTIYRNIYHGVNEYDGINSRLAAMVKISIGFNIRENVNLEIYYKHFSNGNLNQPNHGYNFLGVSVAWLL
ncbi:MAG: hypothetical protein RL208_46 [Pseudomonadota bacterium]|jgi:hypothetical protein